MPQRRQQLQIATLALAAGAVFPIVLATVGVLGTRTPLATTPVQPAASLGRQPLMSIPAPEPMETPAAPRRKPTDQSLPVAPASLVQTASSAAPNITADAAEPEDVEPRQPFIAVRALPLHEPHPVATPPAWELQLAGLERKLDQLAQADQERKISDLERALQVLQQLQTQLPPGTAAPPFPAAAPSEKPEEPPPAAAPPVTPVVPLDQSSSAAREPVIRVERGAGDRETFSLQIDDAELTHVLDLFGQLAGINILASPGVRGKVTLNLQQVSMDDALAALLRSQNCVAEREGDFLYVQSAAEAANRQLLQRKVITKVYQPFYVSAKELQPLITPILTPSVGKVATTNPSEIGLSRNAESAGGDQLSQGDALVVMDYPEVLEAVDRIVADLDIPPVQIAISAQILSVKLNDSLKFGVNFALLNSSASALALFGNGQTLNGGSGFPGTGTGDIVPPMGEFLANTAGLKYGFIQGDATGFIQALENISDVSLVASPETRVLNKQKAEIIIGERLSYKTLAFNGTQTVENVNFLEAGTMLIIRPFVSPDGLIRMEVHPERSSATINADTGLPNQSTTEVTTNVMVRDQTTIVIGGLISEESVESIDRVPLLGAIPWVGAAFRNKTESVQRTELIVLITPRIITDDIAAVEGESIQHETQQRAMHFRDHLAPINRHNLARAHYERAVEHFDRGELLKAHQQVTAALRQNKSDLDSLRLRDQINAALDAQRPQFLRWPGKKDK